MGTRIDYLMVSLTRRQRQALMALGLANLIALSVLGVVLLRARSSAGASVSPPLTPQRLEVCRQAVSRALLEAGQSGMVQTRQDGVILVQLQRPITTTALRLDADSAVWTALQAVASQSSCLGHRTVQITVLFTSPTQDPACPEGSQATTRSADECQPLRATARVDMPDLLLWWLGGIDDAELTSRVNYQPPATPRPLLPEATGIP